MTEPWLSTSFPGSLGQALGARLYRFIKVLIIIIIIIIIIICIIIISME